MSRQHHFVVVWDSKTHQWTVDDDTANARFPEGLVFDERDNDWHDQTDFGEDDALAARDLVKRLAREPL